MELFYSDWSSPGDWQEDERDLLIQYLRWSTRVKQIGQMRKGAWNYEAHNWENRTKEETKKCYYGCPWRIQQRTERETYHLPQEDCYKKIQSVSALQKTILLHAIRIITCVVEWTTSLLTSFLLCKINVCRFVCIYLIFDNFIDIFLLSDSNFKKLVPERSMARPLPLWYVQTRHVSIKREKKRYLHSIKKNKKKEKKESKMKINTELVGEKVPENKSCLPFFLAFCKVYYLRQGQIYI